MIGVHSVRIERSPDEVWRVLADFGALSRWAHHVEHSRLVTARSAGVGTSRRVQIGRLAIIERVVAWRTGTSLAYALEGLPLVRSVVNTWTLESVGPATQVSLTSQVDGSLASRLLLRLLLARESKKLLTALKDHVEEAS